MLIFLKFFILFIISLNLLFGSFFEINEDFSVHSLFILFFLTVLYLNYRINYKQVYVNFDLDIFYKFFYILLKTPNFFVNYFLNIFKKIYLYLVHFKFRYLRNTIKIINKKYFSGFFLIWRPLFKKTSYFGYYRSNRSKWIK